jgi:outer membrane protein assembly factor BamB
MYSQRTAAVICFVLIILTGCATLESPKWVHRISKPSALSQLNVDIQYLATWSTTVEPSFEKKRILEKAPWQWRGKFALGAAPQTFISPIFLGDGEVLLGTLGGGLQTLKLKTGSVKWNLDMLWGLGSQPLVDESELYIAGLDGKIRKLKLNSGEEVWASPFDSESWSGIAKGSRNVYLTTGDDSLWAFDSKTGAVQWTYKRPAQKSSVLWSLRGGTVPILDSTLSNVFAGFSDGVVVCLNAQTGQTVWERNFDRPGRFKDADQKMLYLADLNIVLVPLVDGDLVALKISDGTTLWTLSQAGGSAPVRSLVDSSSLYVSTHSGEFQKVDLKDTKTLWSTPFGDGIVSEATEIGRLLVAVTHSARGLLVFNQKTGELVYEFAMGPGALSSPVYENGRLLVLSPRNRLHSFRVDEVVNKTQEKLLSAVQGIF